MRYRLIDTEQLEILVEDIDNLNYKDCLQADVDSVMLSEEETLAKFKDIFEEGIYVGNSIARGGDENTDEDWEDLKTNL